MVEMALLLPVLIAIMFGIMDFSYYVFVYATVENAARRGGEKAATLPPSPAQALAAHDNCTIAVGTEVTANILPLNINKFTVAISYPDATTNVSPGIYPTTPTQTIGTVIQVKVTYTGQWLTPIGPLYRPGGNGTFTRISISRRSITNVDSAYC